MNINRMLLRLYMYPVLFLLIFFIVTYILSSVIPSGFTGPFLSLGEKAKSFAPMAGALPLGISALWFLVNTYKFWQWSKGNCDDTCHHCGGLTSYHSEGSYGPYFKCMACGNNRADKH